MTLKHRKSRKRIHYISVENNPGFFSLRKVKIDLLYVINPLQHNPNFELPKQGSFWKHCENMRKCWWPAFLLCLQFFKEEFHQLNITLQLDCNLYYAFNLDCSKFQSFDTEFNLKLKVFADDNKYASKIEIHIFNDGEQSEKEKMLDTILFLINLFCRVVHCQNWMEKH